MLHTLKNGILTVEINDRGAELFSVRRDGCEYLWQGDPAYWAGRAPNLFPICGRLYEGVYTWESKTYEMILHGFAKVSDFRPVRISDAEMRFVLESDAETKKSYPFDFVFTVSYRLNGNRLETELSVVNTDEGILPFAWGAHPGFNVPLGGEGDFSDYVLEFSEPCSPDELIFSDDLHLNTGKKRAYPLEGGRRLPLSHRIFDTDALFLSRVADTVTLKSEKSARYVTFHYPEFPYLGIWHAPKSDAPYVCIEPWCGLPAYHEVTDDFATKSDMFRILPGESKTARYEITFG